MLPSEDCSDLRYSIGVRARLSLRGSRPAATSPWIANAVDWAFESPFDIWPKPPSGRCALTRYATARFTTGDDRWPAATIAWSAAPVSSTSLAAPLSKPKPPSLFCAPSSVCTAPRTSFERVVLPAARSARMPKTVWFSVSKAPLARCFFTSVASRLWLPPRRGRPAAPPLRQTRRPQHQHRPLELTDVVERSGVRVHVVGDRVAALRDIARVVA